MTPRSLAPRALRILPLLLGAILFAISCASLQHAREASLRQDTFEQLQAYEKEDQPKTVLHWLFRDDRKTPDYISLVALLDWEQGHRWQFVKLLDKLDGDRRPAFITAFAEMLKKEGRAEAFLDAYKESDSKSFIELREALKSN